MRAIRVHRFGGVETLVAEDVPRPAALEGEVVVQVKAAGVGPWDALIRSGRSVLPQPLPLTLGSDIAGIVAAVGPGVTRFAVGDRVFGATNGRFTGGYADYAAASAGLLAKMPARLTFVEAASVPVVACTAWQMVLHHGQVGSATRVLVLGGRGNVGAYAVQFARRVAGEVVATARGRDVPYVRRLGADAVVNLDTTPLGDAPRGFDVVLDTVGGDAQVLAMGLMKPSGLLVSAVPEPNLEEAARHGVRALFFLVQVSSEQLDLIATLIDGGDVSVNVGDVLPLAAARTAHEMLEGKPHRPGKIVLDLDARA